MAGRAHRGARELSRSPDRSIESLDLERVAAAAWVPDERVVHAGWWLRAAEGFTGRANSALALADPGGDLDDVLADVVSWYRHRGLPALVAVPRPVLDVVAERLLDRGWGVHHGGRVLVRAMAGLADRPGTAAVAIAPAPDAAWLAASHHRGTPLPAAGHRMLVRGDTGFASIRHDDDVVAIGRGVVVDDGPHGRWLVVNAIETDPAHRRRGHASDVLAALATWAGRRGADRVVLQVDLTNDVAATVHRRAGFVEHHHYHYLAAPHA